MIHEEEEEEEEEDDGFFYDGYQGDPQDPFDGAWRFGFSMGPNGMRIQEPPVFGQIIKEMEEIFSQMGHWNKNPESGLFGIDTVIFCTFTNRFWKRNHYHPGGLNADNQLNKLFCKDYV